MQYKVIEAKDEALNLQDKVNRHLEDGWVPVGGVAVGYSPQSYQGTGHCTGQPKQLEKLRKSKLFGPSQQPESTAAAMLNLRSSFSLCAGSAAELR
jgi:hypothetical protein